MFCVFFWLFIPLLLLLELYFFDCTILIGNRRRNMVSPRWLYFIVKSPLSSLAICLLAERPRPILSFFGFWIRPFIYFNSLNGVKSSCCLSWLIPSPVSIIWMSKSKSWLTLLADIWKIFYFWLISLLLMDLLFPFLCFFVDNMINISPWW